MEIKGQVLTEESSMLPWPELRVEMEAPEAEEMRDIDRLARFRNV